MNNRYFLSVIIAGLASGLVGCASEPPLDVEKINAEYEAFLKATQEAKDKANDDAEAAEPDQTTATAAALPADAETCSYYGSLAANNGNLDNSIRYFDEAIRLKPDYSDAYIGRGLTYSLENDPDKSMADFNEAVRLAPKDEDAYFYRGLGYSASGESDPAIADLSKAIRLNPQYADAYMNRGIVYDSQGKLDPAIMDYSKTIELINLADKLAAEANKQNNAYSPPPPPPLPPTIKEAKEALATKLGVNPEQLKDKLSTALGLDPKQVKEFEAGGNSPAKQEIASWTIPTSKKELKQLALASVNAAVNRSIKRARARINKIKKKLLKWLEGPPPPQDNVKVTVKPAGVHFRLGSAYARKSEINGALANYNAAIKLDGWYAQAYYQRAVVYSAVQEYTSAILDGWQFLALVPNDPQAAQMQQWIKEWETKLAEKEKQGGAK
ncbi:MAG: tetratricopeptide repeat protein [Planctomycetota bacterium]